MKGIYLCAKEHRIKNYDIDYNDIINYEGINIVKDCREINLSNYDYIICTPPCNYYSRANYRREISKIAQETKEILPTMIEKCINSGKPFIIENVLNKKLLPKADLFIYYYGQHTYYTNILLPLINKNLFVRQNKQYISPNKRDNNFNVDFVIKCFLEQIIYKSDKRRKNEKTN